MKLALALLLPLTALAADPPPDPAEVTAAMKKAVAFHQEKLAVHGGYASRWKKDLSAGMSEHGESKTLISIQPPGVTAVGLVLVKAYQATGDKQFLEAARSAGKCLTECQLATGGWSADFDFAPEKAKQYHLHQQVLAGDTERGKRKALSTLDDNKTQSALLFLLELAHLPECKDDAGLQETLKFGLYSLLGAQFPNGAWPQQFDGPADASLPVKKAVFPKEWPWKWPNIKYHTFYTLNDDNMQKCVELMLRAHEQTKEERFLAAAKKAGDFFLLAQLPEPQPVWAQQYNQDMEPVWARKFEPPSVTGSESFGVMEALHDLWVVTGDKRYSKPLQPALGWYERSALTDGKYARFYELKTNKPLYSKAGTYELTYDDSDMPTHYGFKLDLARKLESFRKQLAKPREELLANRAGPNNPKSWKKRADGVIAKVRKALETQQPEGYWLDDDFIDAGEFVKHMQSMAIYVQGWRNQ